MLNEERIILMTKMASYEEREGKKNVAIGKYFRGDYIAIQIIKSVFCATIAFVIVFALYILYDFENFMLDLYHSFFPFDFLFIGNLLFIFMDGIWFYCRFQFINHFIPLHDLLGFD